ncbi:MAG: M20 metallopeptidase family protein, partial [Tepidisphaeraceae bacterium]
VKTAEMIRVELQRSGVKFVAGVEGAPTATVAWIGDADKPCIALRADIDALPIVERTGLNYASTHPGAMHACGHDGHTASLVGVASVLKSIERTLPVCVKLIWQPAEEGGGGAKVLCDAGVLDGRIGPKVQAIFGLHGWPALPVGTVSTRPGPLLAATDTFAINFVGKGCHAAFPHLGRDPIVTACEAVVNLQQFVSRDLDPTDSAVVTVGKINAGSATNVIPDRATVEGTARTLTEDARKLVREAMHRRCAGIAAANACDVEFNWQEGYPATVNDAKATEYVERIARQTIGENAYIPAARPVMGGEDFAYYLQRVPGCFFFLGVMPPGQSDYPQLHTDRFDFTDAALRVGMRMFVELALNWRG